MQRVQPEDLRRARRRNRRGIVHLLLGDQLRAPGRVVGRDHLDARQRPQEPIALRQRLRMRIDAAHPLHRHAGQRQQVVDDRQLDLADDRQVVLEEQIEVAVDAAPDRVLDRQHAVVGRPRVDRVEDVLEAAARHELGVGIHLPRRRLAERSGLTLIGNTHNKKGHHLYRMMASVSDALDAAIIRPNWSP